MCQYSQNRRGNAEPPAVPTFCKLLYHGKLSDEKLSAIPAVANGRVHEIKSPLILQPGPAALTDGLNAIVAALRKA
jgi:hypothetical protein